MIKICFCSSQRFHKELNTLERTFVAGTFPNDVYEEPSATPSSMPIVQRQKLYIDSSLMNERVNHIFGVGKNDSMMS